MKKVLFPLIMTFVMVAFSSCSNKRDLSGTTWLGSIPIEDTDMSLDAKIVFDNDSTGVLSVMFLGESMDSPFTYECDSKGNGKMIVTDSQTGDVDNEVFAIIGDELTVTEGQDKFTFTKQK